MSTTIKRIALVAVAALGLGVMSVAPSTATTNADTLTLSAATAAQLTGETATATSATVTLSYLADSAADSMTVTASLVSGPATSVALPKLILVETSSAQASLTAPAGSVIAKGDTTGVAANTKVFVVPSGTVPAIVSAKFNVFLAAPSVAGTYVVRLTPAVSGVGVLNATAKDLTITVTAAPADDLVAATATSILNAGETASATADAVVTSTRTQGTTLAGTAAAATIKITTLNKSGLAAGESFTATIAGPGVLGSGANTGAGSPLVISGPTPTARVLVVKNGDVVQVFPDGTSGVATITIASMLGVELAKETVTFFGAPATITTTVKKPVLGGTSPVAEVLEVVVKDSAGVSVSNLGTSAFGVVSSDITKIATVYGSTTSAYSTTTGSYLVHVTPVAAGTANLTVTTKASATDTDGINAAATVSVRVGGAKTALDGLTVATDKTSYAPGELVTLTVTPLDAAGLVLADETHTVFTAAGIVSSHILVPSVSGAVMTLAGAHDGGVDGTGTKLGVATYKFYAPNIEGDLTLSWTRSTSFATAANDSLTGKVTIAVSSPGTAAATDAANEATDAANAATDAALAAAEAADAATSAAQEASDAVAALSESVTKLIAGLQSQIKSLAAVVAKIAKKVKA
jgi:hypothetical protein